MHNSIVWAILPLGQVLYEHAHIHADQSMCVRFCHFIKTGRECLIKAKYAF